MVKNSKIDNITVCGGSLCIDFINTVRNRTTLPLEDYLSDFNDLLYWSKRLSVIDAAAYKKIELNAINNKRKADLFFKGALDFRELLYKIFCGICKGKKIPAADLEEYNKILSAYFPFIQLKRSGFNFVEDWNFEQDSLMYILAPVVNDSYELLLTDKLKRIGECPKCRWLFLDTTKNGKRRWCTMKTCGSSVKALEWYHRQKKNQRRK